MKLNLFELLPNMKNNDYNNIESYIRRYAGGNVRKYTKLLWNVAVPMNSPMLIDILVSNGASINSKNESGEGLLHVVDMEAYDAAKSLIRNGCNVNARDNKGYTPLHVACENGYTNIVKLLIEKNANVNARDLEGRTPLYVACSNNNVNMKIVNFLLDYGADANIVDNNDMYVLYWACVTGNKQLFGVLFERSNDKIRQDKRMMHYACIGGNVDIVRFLAQMGTPVNERSDMGMTPLMSACNCDSVDVVKYLVKMQDVNVNDKDNNGYTALHWACVSLGYEVAEVLLNENINIDDVENEGLTALYIACINRSNKIASLLVRKGASLNKNINGRLPIYYACNANLVDVVVEMIREGSDLRLANKSTVLHWAARMGYVMVLDAIMERKENIDVRDFLGKTPLHLATSQGDILMVRRILHYKANVDAKDKGDGTALHIACKNQLYDIAQELINSGANVKMGDISGQTALHWACNNGDEDMVVMLLKNGANANSKALTGDTPLYIAYRNNFSHLIKHLLDLDKVDDIPNYVLDWIIDEQDFSTMRKLIYKGVKVKTLMKKLVMLNKKQALSEVAKILRDKKINISTKETLVFNRKIKRITLLSTAVLNNSVDVADILMRNNSCSVHGTIKKLSDLLTDEVADRFLKEINNSAVNKIKRKKIEAENMLIRQLMLSGEVSKKRVANEDIEISCTRKTKRGKTLE